MRIFKHKITPFSIIAAIIFMISCDKNEFDSDSILNEEEEFRYKTEKVFCQSNPENEMWLKTFSYDTNANKIEEISYYSEEPYSKTEREFNENNQPLTELVSYYTENNWIPDHRFDYVYSNNRLHEKQQYDSNENLTHKTIYKYVGSKPVWEEFYYYTNNSWLFQYAHKFEYNRNQQLVKKISYQDEAKENIYDQFVYTYKNGKKATEKRILISGETGYFKEYFYTENGLLEEVTEDGNTVQKNYYEKGRLSEKHTWYFGIDPGFYPCSGNLIYRYEY